MKIENLLKKYILLSDENNESTQNINFSKTSISEVANITHHSSYNLDSKNENLYDYIFKFYAYNEILSSYKDKNHGIIPKEKLKTFKDYSNFTNDFSKRIFSFILHACLGEVQHTELFRDIEMSSYNNSYMREIRKEYSKKTIKNFYKGIKNDIFSNFISHYSSTQSKSDYEAIIKSPSKLEEMFNKHLENYGFSPNSYGLKFKNSFDKKYSINFYEKNADIIKYHINKIFNIEYGKNFDLEKFNRFNYFSYFLLDIINKKINGNNGELQRYIAKNKLIEKSNIKDLPVEEMFEFLSIYFKNTFKPKGSYGGEPWSNIAKHALSFSRGEINAEIFIDQALSLEHNGGNMFNKNFIFDDKKHGKFLNLFLNDQRETLYLDINSFILNLQNSSSVLCISHFENTNNSWQHLTTNLKLDRLNVIIPESNQVTINMFEENLDVLKQFTSKFKYLSEMTTLATNFNYVIPKFNFTTYILNAYEKAKIKYIDYITEKNIESNNIFNDILAEKYIAKNTLEKSEPFFKLHNLNSNNNKYLTKELIGGKAYGLSNLINKGFNVPKALVFDTKTCLSYIDNKEHFNEEYNNINQKISNYLIDNKKQPLLVSVRSGAAVSMPGMMDSILNVGIDDKTYPLLCKTYGKKVIDDCAISFMNQFCNSKFNLNISLSTKLTACTVEFKTFLKEQNIIYNEESLFPLSKEDQIKLSVEAVFDSWNSPRAIAWRNEKNIDHNLGTAATVQQMVFGNKNDKSFTCVIFSRDCITGKPDIMGEYLPQAQGEDLVSGKKTPLPISQLKITHPQIYQEIEFIAKILEEEQKAIQDIEITVEDSKVYVLQMRNAIVSPEAQLALAKDMGLNLLDVIQTKSLIGEAKVDTLLDANYNGLAASPGLISGIIVRNQKDIDKYRNEGKDLIFFSNQALPEHAPIMIATQGFITEVGGATSHAAILARSMGKPCVVGIGKQESNNLQSGSIVTIDAIEGKIWKGKKSFFVNQDKAINLSFSILKENKIKLPVSLPNNNLLLKSWTTKLSNYNVLNNSTNKKHKFFLNIAQQTALVLQMEHKKNCVNKITV